MKPEATSPAARPIRILPAKTTGSRPFWSVMIPAYRPEAGYLRQALESVLQQAPSPEQMQIEVVDDCSPGMDVAGLVKAIAGDRVGFSQTPKNLGLAGCWNTCIERARGHWVHILHQDDFVLSGFYQRLALAAQQHPEFGLLATRSFLVDEDGVISGITERIKELEDGGRVVDRFFYHTPIQCPGVAVKRAWYESNGGFLEALVSGLDCEMWARVVGSVGGVVTPEALACFRWYHGGQTGRLARSAEIHADTARTNQIFAERYPAFDVEKARQRVLNEALERASYFTWIGDEEAARKNLDYWKANAPFKKQLRRSVHQLCGLGENLARRILGG